MRPPSDGVLQTTPSERNDDPVLPLVLTLLTAATPAPVPMPGDTEAARFKEYFERGEALYQQGDFGPAIFFFKQADSQRVTPEVAYDLAKSYEKLGDLAFSTFYFRLYLRRAPNAPDTLTVAEQVGKALTRAEAESKGFLELDAPRATKVTVTGQWTGALRFPEPPVAIFLPAGDYDVEAAFPTGLKRMKVQIRQGQTATVSFEPVRPPMIALENALPAELIAKGIESGPAASQTKPMRIGAYTAFGVAAAALVTGTVLGVMSANEANELKTNRTLTVRQAQALADSANGKAIGANLLWGAAGAAVATGGLLFVFSMPEPGMKGTK